MPGVLRLVSCFHLVSELAEAVQKSKELWDRIRNAPQEIRDQLDYLKVLVGFLEHVEQELFQDGGSTSVPPSEASEESLIMCKKAHGAMHEFLESLAKDLDTKSALKKSLSGSSLKLKEKKLARLEKHLDRTVQLLQMSLAARKT